MKVYCLECGTKLKALHWPDDDYRCPNKSCCFYDQEIKNCCRFGSELDDGDECIDTYMGCYHRRKQ